MSAIHEWESFLVAMVGAAAALAGLLVVAISINLREILRYPWLPGRAGETVGLLAAALAASGLALLPEQSLRMVGIEILLVGLVACVLPIAFQLRARERAASPDGIRQQPQAQIIRVGFLLMATGPMIVGGALLVGGVEAGMYVFAAGVLIAFMVSLLNAWVLLVEVLR